MVVVSDCDKKISCKKIDLCSNKKSNNKTEEMMCIMARYKYKIWIFFIVYLCFVDGGYMIASQDTIKQDAKPTHKQLVTKLRAWQKNMTKSPYLSLQWTQIQYKALRDRTVQHEGTGLFRLPHTFLWDMKSQGQGWLFNGKELVYLDHQRKSALSYAANAQQGREFLRFIGLVTQFEDLTAEFHIISLKEKNNVLQLQLKPKQKGDLTLVQVKYLREQALISQIRMDFASKNHTIIKFRGHSRAKLADSAFQIPSNLSVQKVQSQTPSKPSQAISEKK